MTVSIPNATKTAVERYQREQEKERQTYLKSDEYKMTLIDFTPSFKGMRSADLAVRNLNPGNIKSVRTGKFRKFNTLKDGYDALIRDIEIKQSGRSRVIHKDETLWKFIHIYAPAHDNNNPSLYAWQVANWLGIDINTPFNQINKHDLAKYLIKKEDCRLFALMYPTPPEVQEKVNIDLNYLLAYDHENNIPGSLVIKTKNRGLCI